MDGATKSRHKVYFVFASLGLLLALCYELPVEAQDTDACQPNPCMNGICVNKDAGYQCYCEQGYTGNQCEININECNSSPCGNGATCIDEVDNFRCSCLSGWTGRLCGINIDECLPNPCLNSGICIDEVNNYTCNCGSGFTGDRCEIKNDGSNCAATNDPPHCGHCSSPNGGPPCTCDSGWKGDSCEIENDGSNCTATNDPSHCGNCTGPNDGPPCTCDPGWRGDSCEIDIDDCLSSSCLNSGVCVDGFNSYTCNCSSGFTGDQCEINVDECASNPCFNDGTCIDGDNGFNCTCLAGWEGWHCQENIDDCLSSSCLNSGVCVDGFNSYTCNCIFGFTGDQCEINVDECASDPCFNDGTCIDVDNGFNCTCLAGWEGWRCQENIDDCAPQLCMNGASCVDGINSYGCICSHGYTGHNCGEVDDCASAPCLNGGVCTDDVNSYNCSCAAGYRGNDCETNIDDCTPKPCVNGVCVDGINTYSCICLPGFTGTNCEDIDDCASNPCLNGGVCTDGKDSYTCTCAAGYEGIDCRTNINDCASNPCVNGGLCTDGVDSFTCACAEGYVGHDCGISTGWDSNVVVAVISALGAMLLGVVAALIIQAAKSKARHRAGFLHTDLALEMGEAEASVMVAPQGTTPSLEEALPSLTLSKGNTPQGVVPSVYEDAGLPSWAARWEILWSNLDVDEEVLGGGNFGEVRSGSVVIDGEKTRAAIKILKGEASPHERADFMEELRTMSSIGYHQNVVSLLGACQHEDVLYVALEYLPNGNLRSYLRQARQKLGSEEAVSSAQLVKFALDVAKGMRHLAQSGVIHRDLAARNILLGEGLIAKVSDFGLSRGEDIYVQTSLRRVPTRWLAIESVMHQTYTTQSDVWSFGIVLWEIATLGETPYPDVTEIKTLASRLREGYRMPKPSNCDEEIYNLMLRCWDEDPNDRPSFTDLVSILSYMDENRVQHTYMVVNRRSLHEDVI